MHHFLIVLLLVASFACDAAAPPILYPNATAICPTISPGEWMPSQAEIQLLEQALPAYFQPLRLKERRLPARGHSYARQYTGITRNGKRLIYGLFYPTSDALASKARAGDCWEISDGGNQYWSVTFDPKARSFNAFRVNGVA